MFRKQNGQAMVRSLDFILGDMEAADRSQAGWLPWSDPLPSGCYVENGLGGKGGSQRPANDGGQDPGGGRGTGRKWVDLRYIQEVKFIGHCKNWMLGEGRHRDDPQVSEL